MKILHVIATMRVGGAQRLIADLIPRFNKVYTNDVLVFLDADNVLVDKLKESGIEIISLKQKNIYNPFISLKLVKYIRQYDIVHVHLFPTIYWVAIASFFCKTKLVYTEHNTENRRRGKKIFEIIDKLLYSRYRRIISISDGTQVELCKWLGTKTDDKRFVTINNGVIIDNFRNQTKTNLPCTDSKVKLMMVGRFAKAKDQNTIIRAITRLNTNYHLYLVGDGPRLEEAKEFANTLGVTERIHFLGTRSDVPQLVATCDIGIQSSLWEGFGLTAVELMAAGKPVIASKTAGLQQVVEGAGLLFDIGDDKQLAQCIKHLAEDRDYYHVIASKCSSRAEEYDISIMVEKYLNEYKQIGNES